MKAATSVLIVAMLLVAYGCPPKPVYVPISERAGQPVEQEIKAPDTQADRDRLAKEKKGGIEEELLQRDLERQKMLQEQMKQGTALLNKDILFEYDSYTVAPEYQGLVKDVAAWLNQNQAIKLAVEGHCDERGTIDYNLALGQKRAEAVKGQLVKLGVKEERIKTISYGKEMPADPGHTEAAWAKNRRAHFQIESGGPK
jgi:peptidoglycan-associated lipoprotein